MTGAVGKTGSAGFHAAAGAAARCRAARCSAYWSRACNSGRRTSPEPPPGPRIHGVAWSAPRVKARSIEAEKLKSTVKNRIRTEALTRTEAASRIWVAL